MLVKKRHMENIVFLFALPSLSQTNSFISYLFSKYILSILEAKCNDNSE